MKKRSIKDGKVVFVHHTKKHQEEISKLKIHITQRTGRERGEGKRGREKSVSVEYSCTAPHNAFSSLRPINHATDFP